MPSGGRYFVGASQPRFRTPSPDLCLVHGFKGTRRLKQGPRVIASPASADSPIAILTRGAGSPVVATALAETTEWHYSRADLALDGRAPDRQNTCACNGGGAHCVLAGGFSTGVLTR